MYSAEVTQAEDVVELAWCRRQAVTHSLEQGEASKANAKDLERELIQWKNELLWNPIYLMHHDHHSSRSRKTNIYQRAPN
eukprot:5796442-Amphidinium_carterae.1